MARSDPGLDLYRAFAVLGMFAVHASRIERVVTPPAGLAELADRVLAAFRWGEPFILASFLFIAGHSLVLSRGQFGDGPERRWVVKILRRAAGLYLLSVALFIPQYGVALPDLLVSSGVLSAIALAITLIGLGLATPRPALVLSSIALLVLSMTAVLDLGGGTIPGLNAGPGGAFPLVAFAAFGALVALVVRARGLRGLVVVSAALLPVTAAALISEAPWSTERVSHYSMSSASSALGALLRGDPTGNPVAIAFWNHSAVGALGLLLALSATLFCVLAVQRGIAESRLLLPALVLGRHALLAYVLHLALLGLIDAFELAPAGPLGTLGLVLALALICWAAGAGLERRGGVARATERDRAPA